MILEKFKQNVKQEVNNYIKPRNLFKNRHHVNEANKLLKEINACNTKGQATIVLDSFINAYDGSEAITEYTANQETFILLNKPDQFQQPILPQPQKYRKKSGSFYKLLTNLKKVLNYVEDVPSPIRRTIKRDKTHSAINTDGSTAYNSDDTFFDNRRKHLSKLKSFTETTSELPSLCNIKDIKLDLTRCYDDQIVPITYYSYTSPENRGTFDDLKDYVLLPFLKSLIAILKKIDNNETIINYIFDYQNINSPLFFFYSMGRSITLIHEIGFSHFITNYTKELVIEFYETILSVTEQIKSFDDYFNSGLKLKNRLLMVFTNYKNNNSHKSNSFSLYRSKFEEEKKEPYRK